MGVNPAQSYEDTVCCHTGRLRRLCGLLLGDSQEAEEVVQEVFVKALESERRQGPPADWGPWLTRIAVNTCRDRRRAGWWQRFRRWSDQVELVPIADPGLTPEDAAIGAEERRRIWEAFRTLPDRQREVFVLRHLEDWSGPEIAAALGLSPGTVKRHLFRAVHRLRLVLGDSR
jgi:RNA polymerase sigma-70 factor (ECF subfamily)